MASGSKRVVYGALGANLLIAISKTVAATLSGSGAMFAEAVHSYADSGNQALMLLGMHRAKRPPDRRHPFGYGPEVSGRSSLPCCCLQAAAGSRSMRAFTS